MNRNKTISICIPCYNEEENVIKAHKELVKVTNKIKKYTYEFWFVDNGSTDKTKDLIKKISSKDKRVIGVFLSRNFGPEASGQVALDLANGDAFVGIACDLQDPPEMIPKFIKKWEEGYDIVLGVYSKIREDNFFITGLRKLFYKIFKSITEIEVPVGSSGYGLIDKKVIIALRSLPEKYRFMRGLLAWVGFKKAYINYERKQRLYGKSSYNLYSYLKMAERGLFGFSYLILDLMVYTGFILVILSFLFIIAYLLLFFFWGNPIKGAVTILVSIVFFGGVQLLAISIIGKYIQVIVEETKRRPIYIIEEIINYPKHSLPTTL